MNYRRDQITHVSRAGREFELASWSLPLVGLDGTLRLVMQVFASSEQLLLFQTRRRMPY